MAGKQGQSSIDQALEEGMAKDFEKFFADRIKQKPPYAFENKESLIKEFLEYYKKQGKGIDMSQIRPEEYGQLYEQLIDGNSTLQELLDDKEQLSTVLGSAKQESEAMKQIDQTIQQLSHGMGAFRIGTKTLYDAFVDHHQSIRPRNINQMMMCVQSFIAKHKQLNHPDNLYLKEQLDALTKDQYDNTEQVVINAVLKKTLQEYDILLIESGIRDVTTKEAKKADLCRALGRHDIKKLQEYSVVDPQAPQTLQQALEIIHQTFDQTDSTLTQNRIHQALQHCVVSNKDILGEYAITSSLSAADKKALRAGDFQQWNKKTQMLMKQLLKRQVSQKVTKIVAQKTLEATIDTFATTNGSFKQLFKMYPPHEALSNNPKLSALIDEINTLREQAAALTDEQRNRIKTLEHKKHMMEWELYIAHITKKDAVLGSVLTELKQHKRNTEKLTSDQQGVIMRALARGKVDEVVAHNIALGAGIKNPVAYKKMLLDLLDPDAKTVSIPTRHGSKTIKFKNKKLYGSLEQYSDMIDKMPLDHDDTFNAFNHLQMIFQVDLDDAGSDFELLRKILPQGSFWPMDIPGAPTYEKDGRQMPLIHEGTKIDISGHQGYLSPIAPHDTLDEREGLQRDMAGINADQDMYYYLYEYPANMPTSGSQSRDLVYADAAKKKPIIIKKNPQGKLTRVDMSLDAVGQSPVESQIGSIKTVPGGNILNISGNGIGALMWGATMLMSDDDDVHRQMNETSTQAMKKFEATRSRKQTDNNGNLTDKDKSGDALQSAQDNTEYVDTQLGSKREEQKTADTSPQTTLGAEELKSLLSKNIKGCKNGLNQGDEFVFQSTKSSREGFHLTTPAWIRAIVQRTGAGSITLKFVGTAKPMANTEEGKEYTFALQKPTDGVLTIDKLFDVGNAYAMIDTQNKTDMPTQITILSDNGALSSDDAKMFHGLKRDQSKGIFRKKGYTDDDSGGKASKKSEEEISCFAAEMTVGSSGLAETNKMVLYHYKKKGDKIEVTADIPLLDKPGETWHYKREMPYDAFLLFVSSLKLNPLTKSQEKVVRDNKKAVVPGSEGRKTKREGLRFMRKGLKGLRDKGIKKYFDDYEAEHQEIADDWIYMHSGIGKLFEKIPWIGAGFKDVREDYEDGYYDRRWKKIEDKKKSFVDNPDFGGVINDTIMPHYLGKETDQVKTVAGLLALLEKGRYPLIGKKNTSSDVKTPGQRVLRVLGPQHYERFQGIYAAKLAEAQKVGNTANPKYQNDLMKAELQYMIDALNGDLSLEGDMDKPVTQGLQYTYSKKLADALESGMNNREMSSKAVGSEEIDKKKTKKFPDVMSGFFNDEIIKGKTASCISSLIAMANIMVTDDEIRKFQMCMTAFMLSGLAEHEIGMKNKGTLGELTRKAGLPIGNWREDIEQRRKLSTLLDYITKDGEGNNHMFSKAVGYKIQDFDSYNYRVGVMKDIESDGFFARYKKRWLGDKDKQGMGKMVSDFLSLRDLNGEKNIINVAKNKNINQSEKKEVRPEPDELLIVKELEEAISQDTKKASEDVKNKHIARYGALSVGSSAIMEFYKIKNGDYADPSSHKDTQSAKEYLKEMKKYFDQAHANNKQISKEVYTFLFKKYKEGLSIYNNNDANSIGLALGFYSKGERSSASSKDRQIKERLGDNLLDTVFVQNAKRNQTNQLPSELESTVKAFRDLTKKALDQQLIDENLLKDVLGESAASAYTRTIDEKLGYKPLLLPEQYEFIKNKPKKNRTQEEQKLFDSCCNSIFQKIIGDSTVRNADSKILVHDYSYVGSLSGGGAGSSLPRDTIALDADVRKKLHESFSKTQSTRMPSNLTQRTENPTNYDYSPEDFADIFSQNGYI